MHRLNNNNNNNKWKYNCTDWNYGLKFDNWWSIVFKNVILLFAIFISIKIYPLLQGNFINYLKYLFEIEVEEWICCLYYRTSECLGFVHVSWTGWLLAPSCYKALVMPRNHEIARFSHNFTQFSNLRPEGSHLSFRCSDVLITVRTTRMVIFVMSSLVQRAIARLFFVF
jgi:hypothetical protein